MHSITFVPFYIFWWYLVNIQIKWNCYKECTNVKSLFLPFFGLPQFVTSWHFFLFLTCICAMVPEFSRFVAACTAVWIVAFHSRPCHLRWLFFFGGINLLLLRVHRFLFVDPVFFLFLLQLSIGMRLRVLGALLTPTTLMTIVVQSHPHSRLPVVCHLPQLWYLLQVCWNGMVSKY